MKMKRVKYIYVAMLLLGTTSCADMLDRFHLTLWLRKLIIIMKWS